MKEVSPEKLNGNTRDNFLVSCPREKLGGFASGTGRPALAQQGGKLIKS